MPVYGAFPRSTVPTASHTADDAAHGPQLFNTLPRIEV